MSNISGLGRGTRTRVRRSHTATVFEIEARAALAAVRMIRPSIGLRDGRAKFEESESLHHHIVVVRALFRVREARLDRLPARVDQRSPIAPFLVLLARHPYVHSLTNEEAQHIRKVDSRLMMPIVLPQENIAADCVTQGKST